jgi:hypothetical protein
MTDEIFEATLKEHRAMRDTLVKIVGTEDVAELGELQRCLPLLREKLVLSDDLLGAVDVLRTVQKR